MTATISAGADPADIEIPPDVYRRRWVTLGVLCTSLMIVVIANTSLNVALPTISEELGLSNSAQQWVIDAYSLVFAGLLFTAGSLGDRWGRKRFLQAGIVIFGLASVFATFFVDTGDGADRHPRRHGHRRGARHAGDAVDPRQHVPQG